jgi:large subunit ribosomal protein L22
VATQPTTTERPEVRAEAKWVRISPRKARLVVEHIRGRTVPEARTVLAFTPKAAAREVEKVLRSAVANAEANHGLIGDDLLVSAAYVDEGPTIKRWRARARGRVARIRKRTCHITVRLAPAAQSGLDGEAAAKPTRAAQAQKVDQKPADEAKPKRKTTRKKKEAAN